MKQRALLVGLSCLVPTPAWADGGPGNSVRFKTILVPFTLSGATDGKGTAKFGAGLAWGAGARTDMAASLNAAVATNDGIANLFSSTSSNDGIKQSTPWEVGASIAVARLSPTAATDPDSGLPPAVRKRMFDACNERCTPGSDDGFCKSRSKELGKRTRKWVKGTSDSLPVEQFCTKQRKAVKDVDESVQPKEGTMPTDAAPNVRKKVRETALSQCVTDCISEDADRTFCGSDIMRKAQSELYEQYDKTNTCTAGKQIYDDYQDDQGRSLFPDFQLTFGGAAGREKFNYRAGEMDSTTLLKKADTNWHWKAGASAFWLTSQMHPVNTTIEAMALFASDWEASDKTIKWCTPAGDVPRTEPKPGEAVGPTDPAETCQDGLLGGPTRTYAATTAVRFGVIDGRHGSWRVAFGPQLRIPRGDGRWNPVEVVLQLPIYGAATLFPGVDYKGVLRLTPSAGWKKTTDGEQQFTVGVELALIGQRRILSDRFDEL